MEKGKQGRRRTDGRKSMGDADLAASVFASVRRSPWAFDLVTSAFFQALLSRRRPSICTPFPHFLFAAAHGEKDYDAALAAARCIPAFAPPCRTAESQSPDPSMDNDNVFSTLPEKTLKLLHWLLKLRYDVELVQDLSAELPRSISQKFCGSHGLTPPQMGLIPDYILKLQEIESTSIKEFDDCQAQFGSVYAFHGTSAENIHSILRCGLLILSNSSLQKNGALYGEGIYLSSDPAVAIGFSQPGKGWEHSLFGQKARYLLLCEVAKGDKVSFIDGSTSNVKTKDDNSWGTYVIVRNADLIKLRYIFVYVDSAAMSNREKLHQLNPILHTNSIFKSINWFKALIILYVILLIGIPYLDSSKLTKLRRS